MLFLTVNHNNKVIDVKSLWYQPAPTLAPLSQPSGHTTVLDWKAKHSPCTQLPSGWVRYTHQLWHFEQIGWHHHR